MSGRIQFTPRPEKIIEALLHLTHRGKFTRYQVVKFFYLADRKHLRKYGRPITYDFYVAMENGPVASITYDLLKGKSIHGIDVKNLPFDLVELGTHFGISNPQRKVNMDVMSRSDIKTLDMVVSDYKDCSFDELYELTHEHIAYDNAWKNRTSFADSMSFDDFFEGIDNQESIIDELAFAARGM